MHLQKSYLPKFLDFPKKNEFFIFINVECDTQFTHLLVPSYIPIKYENPPCKNQGIEIFIYATLVSLSSNHQTSATDIDCSNLVDSSFSNNYIHI